MENMEITVAADGSALGNPGPAGWAWYVDENCWSAGGWTMSTNNRGELMAVLDFLEETSSIPNLTIHFLCDSQYVINSVTKWMPGWKRRGWRKADGKAVLNDDLMKRLDAELSGRAVDFRWVKGHAGHTLNEKVDQLARGAATAYQQGRSPQTGPGLSPELRALAAPAQSPVNACPSVSPVTADAPLETGGAGIQGTLF
ncbi:ribonuclease H family protein [Mobiluncus curtisii]|jgi:hypothetical protein|uniref:Ribonuclease H n=1 Tax=Mobiluncus curtisii ATCC 51333 TaxID=887326 RepID=E6LZS3_9ACTO|nr:ribonuclease H [Mobiluncus curtisii]EFU79846.1 ribonuclease HI [Mobiluncus curtisii ATCC 51333]